jgi:hypothetical protein
MEFLTRDDFLVQQRLLKYKTVLLYDFFIIHINTQSVALHLAISNS